MYDELVKRLRRYSENVVAYKLDADFASAVQEAADAIEELQKAVNFHKFNSELWEDKYNSLADEKWIPVTERKPPLPEDEDVCCVQVIGAVKGRKEAEPVLYSRAYRLRDGERVRIERFVGDGEVLKVTHWMPLPEPPKEE